MTDTTTLDIDAGNSRIKWRIFEDGKARRGSFAHLGRIETLNDLPAASVHRIRVANVASFGGSEALSDALNDRYKVVPVFAITSTTCGGITCGYSDPSRLGVDRWLAIVAARRLTREAFVVADLGTAATLDFVDAAGLHHGGYIVPGLQAMVDALFRRTKDVQVSFGDPGNLEPGTSTVDAVNRGVLAMLRDFIDSSVDRFARMQRVERPVLFVCGGDADVMAPHIQRLHTVVPDLVLDGLAIAIP